MRKDWLLTALENHDITPEQFSNILKQRLEAERKFREEMRIFDSPIPSLIGIADSFLLPFNTPKNETI